MPKQLRSVPRLWFQSVKENIVSVSIAHADRCCPIFQPISQISAKTFPRNQTLPDGWLSWTFGTNQSAYSASLWVYSNGETMKADSGRWQNWRRDIDHPATSPYQMQGLGGWVKRADYLSLVRFAQRHNLGDSDFLHKQYAKFTEFFTRGRFQFQLSIATHRGGGWVSLILNKRKFETVENPSDNTEWVSAASIREQRKATVGRVPFSVPHPETGRCFSYFPFPVRNKDLLGSHFGKRTL